MSYAFRAFTQLTASTASSLRQFAGRRLANQTYTSIPVRTKPGPTPSLRKFVATPYAREGKLSDETARETNQRDQAAQEKEVRAGIEDATKQQIRRPWQREGADQPPVNEENRGMNKAMTKGQFPCSRAAWVQAKNS